MALADTARLVASLELQDKFSATAKRFDSTLSGMERRTSTLSRIGSEAGRGLQTAARNTAVGLVAGGIALTTQITAGIRSLAELEEATAQTEARLKSTGGAANVTAEGVRNLSQELETLTTIDDKAIQRGQNLLLTFTNIRNEVGKGNDIFNQATRTVLDLATAMGTEPEQAALQLGKALNDPIRGLTALRRVGVQFTADQEDQIRALVESGRVMEAQKVILAELNKEFGGSAEAFAKGPGATMRRFADAVEEGQQALARGFLPLMERLSGLAQDAFNDPKVLAGIENFGEGLAGGLDQLVDIASKLPWEAIGSSLQVAGAGAKALLTAFTSLPPWVQTAVLTGWGLNKLTGGALGNIAGMIGRQAFGALRGSTPATPVFTKEVGLGGAGGSTPVAGRTGGVLGGVAKFVLGPLAAVAIGAEIAAAINESTIAPAREFEEEQFTAVLDSKDANKLVAGLSAIERAQNDPRLLQQTALIASNIPFISDALGNVGPKLEEQAEALRDQLEAQGYTSTQIDAMISKLEEFRSQSSAHASSTTGRWSQEQREAYAQINATRSLESTTAGRLGALSQRMVEARAATDRGFSSTNAQLGSSNAKLAAIQAKDFSPNVNVGVSVVSNVSISDVQRKITSQQIAIGRGPLEFAG